MSSWLRAVIPLALLLCWVMPAFGQDSLGCDTVDFAPPASFAITRGQITGAPGEHTAIMGTIPKDGADVAQAGYLVTGDKVDFVLACRGFSYIRYHGQNQTTTGWIDTKRLKLQGKPFIPLPPNLAQICSGAQRDIDRTSLTSIPLQSIPEGAQVTDDNDSEGSAMNYQTIQVQGRHLAVVRIAEGGSCYSAMARVWTSDFKRQLSPDDFNSRNPVNLTTGGNAWAMGLAEDVVMVDGQPLIRSTSPGDDFELSSIDRTGDTQLLCHGRLRPDVGKPILTEGDPSLCGDLPEAATPIALGPAAGKFTVPSGDGGWLTTKADQWGMIDVDNSGKKKPVGVVNYEVDATRGCGSTYKAQVPVVLHGDVASADQIDAALKALYGDGPDNGQRKDTSRLRIVRLRGQTYVEIFDTSLLADDEIAKAPIQSVWKFGAGGPKQVCTYRTRHYEVKPISPDEK